MVRKAYKKKLSTAEFRQLGLTPGLVTRRVRRPTAKKFTPQLTSLGDIDEKRGS